VCVCVWFWLLFTGLVPFLIIITFEETANLKNYAQTLFFYHLVHFTQLISNSE